MQYFQLYKKRDGQRNEKDGTILASSLEQAKKEFTKEIKSKLEKDDAYLLIDDESVKQWQEDGKDVSFYEGEGFYDISLSPYELVLLNNEIVDSFRIDVHNFEINNEVV